MMSNVIIKKNTHFCYTVYALCLSLSGEILDIFNFSAPLKILQMKQCEEKNPTLVKIVYNLQSVHIEVCIKNQKQNVFQAKCVTEIK